MKEQWFKIKNVESLDTPSLVFFKERILHNIETVIEWVNGDVTRLRPHIKTHKSKNILEILRGYGILKVKTATITETDLAASAGIPDVLMAYQLSNQKIQRFIDLTLKYPQTQFSTLVDNMHTANFLNEKALENQCVIDVFIDVNVGMNRTGIDYKNDLEGFLTTVKGFKNLHFRGFHCYDGHLKDKNWRVRTKDCATYFNFLKDIIQKQNDCETLEIAVGGSNSFPFYAQNTVRGTPHGEGVCCPGTFVLWDENYSENLPEQPFQTAALLVAQVVSIPQPNHICIDIGYKAVASENPLDKRLRILNYDNFIPVSHSEEHLVLSHPTDISIPIGSVIYALPFHICPTVTLYNEAYIIENQEVVDKWKITNSRKI
jgi:D-serine deaminase-like pyridoxal phosphate-dependent protein